MLNVHRARAAVVIGTAALLATMAPAEAAGPKASGVGSVTEYSLPDTSQVRPWGITMGPDGNIWFTTDYGHTIGRVTPTGAITQFPLPTTDNVLMVATGSDGALWVSVQGGTVFRVTTSGAVTNTYTVGADGDGMALGPDGNIWLSGGGTISRVTPAGVVTDFPVDGFTLRITTGPDGNLWFTDTLDFFTTGWIGRITLDGATTLFPVPADADGHTIPWGITAGPDGNLWFADELGRIGRVTTAGDFTFFPAAPGSIPTDITSGPDGNLWFTAHQVGRVVRMTTSGQPTGFPLGAPYSGPYNIVAGPHNTVWFTEQGANGEPFNKIGTIKVCGAASCSLPSAGKPK